MEPNNNGGHVRVQPAQLLAEDHEESMEGMSMAPPAFQLKGADDGDPEENNNDGSGSGGAGGGGGADAPADGGGGADGSVQMKEDDEEDEGRPNTDDGGFRLVPTVPPLLVPALTKALNPVEPPLLLLLPPAPSP